MSPEPKHQSWQFPRYWQFNKWYHGSYQLICLISQPILIASKCDWHILKGIFEGFPQLLRPWELLKNWWRYGWMKFVTIKSRQLYWYPKLGMQKTQLLYLQHSPLIWNNPSSCWNIKPMYSLVCKGINSILSQTNVQFHFYNSSPPLWLGCSQ